MIDTIIQLKSLTEREQEVLSYMLRGANDEIQNRLYIAKSTLKTHINKIFSKCSVKNRLGHLDEKNNNFIYVNESNYLCYTSEVCPDI